MTAFVRQGFAALPGRNVLSDSMPARQGGFIQDITLPRIRSVMDFILAQGSEGAKLLELGLRKRRLLLYRAAQHLLYM